MYRCQHFDIRELVSPAVYKRYGEDAWAFLEVSEVAKLYNAMNTLLLALPQVT